MRLGVLLSGTGRTLQNLLHHIQDGRLSATVGCVISSKHDALGLKIANSHRIPSYVSKDSDRIWKILNVLDVELVCLAGYLHKLDLAGNVLNTPVINVHPSLLPEFGGKGMYGHRVHKAVISSKATYTGCTVHIVDEGYDTGRILLQKACPIMEDDTPDSIAQRVFELECQAYPEVIQMFIDNRLM